MTPIDRGVRFSTFEYAPGLLLDVVQAGEKSNDEPAIAWLHGGGWRMQDRTAAPDLFQHFASHGFTMISIDYRLAPGTCHPGQLFDVRRAIRWLREHADDLGIDPDQIGLWGSSAGGHLAALAGIHSTTIELPGEDVDGSVGSAVAAVVDGYGPADLPRLIDLEGPRSPREDASPEAGLLGGAIRDRLPAAVSASPALQVTGPVPPFLIMHRVADTMVPPAQSVALYDALAATGNDATLYLIEGFGHGFLNPGHVLELGPGMMLDQGHLEADPTAPAQTRASTPGGRDFLADHPHASFRTIEAFFSRTLG